MPHALASFEQIIANHCFNDAVPCLYLLCERDHAVPRFVQEMNIKNIGEGCKGGKCDAGHSPDLNQVDLVMTVIKEIARKDA